MLGIVDQTTWRSTAISVTRRVRRLAGGADALSLIDRAEALTLRQNGIDAPILLYAGAPIDAAAVAAVELSRLVLTVLSEREIDVVARHARVPI